MCDLVANSYFENIMTSSLIPLKGFGLIDLASMKKEYYLEVV